MLKQNGFCSLTLFPCPRLTSFIVILVHLHVLLYFPLPKSPQLSSWCCPFPPSERLISPSLSSLTSVILDFHPYFHCSSETHTQGHPGIPASSLSSASQCFPCHQLIRIITPIFSPSPCWWKAFLHAVCLYVLPISLILFTEVLGELSALDISMFIIFFLSYTTWGGGGGLSIPLHKRSSGQGLWGPVFWQIYWSVSSLLRLDQPAVFNKLTSPFFF